MMVVTAFAVHGTLTVIQVLILPLVAILQTGVSSQANVSVPRSVMGSNADQMAAEPCVACVMEGPHVRMASAIALLIVPVSHVVQMDAVGIVEHVRVAVFAKADNVFVHLTARAKSVDQMVVEDCVVSVKRAKDVFRENAAVFQIVRLMSVVQMDVVVTVVHVPLTRIA